MIFSSPSDLSAPNCTNTRFDSLPRSLASADASRDLRVLAYVNELLDGLSVSKGE
jgi:hypothetical protein